MSCNATPVVASEPLVMLRTQDNLHTVIDSFANPTHPVTLCSLSARAQSPKFISPTEIGYAISNATPDTAASLTEIQRMSLIDRRPVTVATVQGDVLDVAWSPDGSNVAYLAYLYLPDGGSANQMWLKVGSAAPQALTPMIPLFGRDGSLSDQTIVSFSHDGKYLLMVDTFVAGAAPASADQAVIQVHSVSDGTLVWVPPSALGSSVATKTIDPPITMAVWSRSSDRLYYRDPAGVHTWDPPTTVGMLAGGLAWYAPSVSPDGSLVAYAANITIQARVEIRNLTDGSVRVLPAMLGEPVLLSDQELIALAPTGHVVLNLVTNQQTPLPGILRPLDTWPH